MKKLILSEVLLLSMREKKAKKVKLDPKRTIIFGGNDTGKSSFLKSIYKTFGASAAKENPQWKKLDPICLVRFLVDEKPYSIIRDGKFYGLFDSNDKLINVYDNITKGIGLAIANLLDFQITLQSQYNELITPPPAFLFLPYYIDQDSGWQNSWSSFSGLTQIKKFRKPIIEYHTGLRSNEYYKTKGEIETIKVEIQNLEDERKLTRNILNKHREKLSVVDFTIDIEAFKDDVNELLLECQKVKTSQESVKGKLSNLYNQYIIVETQITAVKHTLAETRKDYKFAMEYEHDGLNCPACGAHYENSFSERFEIAKDEDRCIELLEELVKSLKEINDKINKENESLSKHNQEMDLLESILNRKKEEIKLRDLIESEGRKEMSAVFRENIQEMNVSIFDYASKEKTLKENLKSIENKERKLKIKDEYFISMKRNLNELDVVLPETSYKDFTQNIPNTGSALPRTLIAYYFSILKVMKKYSTSVFCPIVIDSPNQQAQDIPHVDKILKFIKENQPEDTQMILGLEELYGIDFECPIIKFEEKRSLLQNSEYDEVLDVIKPFLERLHNSGGTGTLFLF